MNLMEYRIMLLKSYNEGLLDESDVFALWDGKFETVC